MNAVSMGHVEVNQGIRHDARIETLMAYTFAGKIRHEHYDQLLNEVVREFLVPNAPLFYASKTLDHDASVLTYIAALGFDALITNHRGPNWPGQNTVIPDACYAVSLAYPETPDSDPDEIEWTEYTPGLNLNLACLAALIQLAREYCEVEYNQGRLLLN